MKQRIATERASRGAGASLGMACSALLFLTACTPSAPPPNPPPLTAAQAAARTVVPLTRPIELVSMAQPLVLDIEIPPPGRNSNTTLTIGLRVSGSDSVEVVGVADSLVASGLAAKVSLTRIGSSASVPLIRQDANGHGPTLWPALDADGYVPKVVRTTVDDTSLTQVGLTEAGRDYRELAFAWAERIEPGKYQLKLQLIDLSPDAPAIPAELLVAYQHKAK